MIGFTLSHARSSRYRHAAQHLVACRAVAAQIEDFGAVLDHPAYERALRTVHGGKAGFWQEVDGSR